MSMLGTIIVAGAVETYDLLSDNFSLWAIFAAGTSGRVIEPDSVLGISFRGEVRMSDYPVEQGAFASYNKVQVPEQIRLQLACEGRNMTRGDFLDQLEVMKKSTDLYDISTPDILYEGYTLSHFDFQRTARNGVTLLRVDAWFEEVRQTAAAAYTANTSAVNSNSPSAANPVSLGTVSAVTPTAAQQTAGQGGFY